MDNSFKFFKKNEVDFWVTGSTMICGHTYSSSSFTSSPSFIQNEEEYRHNYYNQIRLAETQLRLVSKELNKNLITKLWMKFLNLFR